MIRIEDRDVGRCTHREGSAVETKEFRRIDRQQIGTDIERESPVASVAGGIVGLNGEAERAAG
jgi:hypothetical protein